MFQSVKAAMIGAMLAGGAAVPSAAFGQTDTSLAGSKAAAPDTGGTATGVTPEERVKLALASGRKLKNPFTASADAIAQGEPFYKSTCGPCHGNVGGGGMCPSLINEVWVYGSEDDVLFKLVALGSVELQKLGYARVRTETVVGPMPALGAIFKSDEQLWRVLAYVRSVYQGDLAKRNW